MMKPVTLEIIGTAIAAVALLISFLAFFYARRDRDREALNRIESNLKLRIEDTRSIAQTRHEGTSKQLSGIESRLSRVEEALKHMPTQDQFRLMQNSLAAIDANFRELKGAFRSTEKLTDRIDQFLLENKRNG